MTPSPHARPSAFARFGDYEFHHWVAIQAAAGESSTVHRLFALRDADDRNAWFAARERRNEVAGYMEDLATARGLAGALSPRFRQRFPDAIGLPCRYSLIENTVRELASNLKPGLVARLVAAGHWTREQGLAWARLAGDPQQTLRSVVDALRTNRRAAEQHGLAVLALETAGAILDPDNRALAVADLAEDLPEPLLPRALEIVAAVDNEGSRAGGLRALAPRLPQPLRRHALAAVEAFHQTELGLSAHLALADGLAEPERGRQLARACEALARVVASGRSSPEETGFQTSPEESPLLKEVPLDWLERFVRVTVGGKGDWPAVAVQRRAAIDPTWALTQVPRLRPWQRNPVLHAVAQAYLAKSGFDEALAIAEGLDPRSAGEYASLVEDLLTAAPSDRLSRVIELTRPLDAFRRLELLRRVARQPAVPAGALRAIALAEADARDLLLAQAAIADRLDPGEREALLTAVMEEMNEPGRAAVVTELAPRLNLEELRRVLAACKADASLADGKALSAIAEALAALHCADEAIELAATLPHLLEFERGELLARLAQLVPDEALPALRDAVRSGDVALDLVFARAALLSALPTDSAERLHAQALALPKATDRLRGLSALASVKPTAGSAAALLQAIEAAMSSRHLDLGHFMLQGFRALGCILAASIGDASMIESAIGLLERHQVSATWTIRSLAALAEAAPVQAKRALWRAIEVADANPERLDVLRHALGKAHAPALAEWVEAAITGGSEPDRVAPVLDAVAGLLGTATRARAAEWIAKASNIEQRFIGLSALLPKLPRGVARRIAQAQFECCNDWSRPARMHLLALSVLAPHAPRAAARHLGDLPYLLLMLRASESVPLLKSLIEAVPQAQAHLGEALRTLSDEPIKAQADVLAVVAPVLDAATAKQWLERLPHDPPQRAAWGALIARLVLLDRVDEALTAVERIDNRFWKDEVIEQAAPALPDTVLDAFAGVSHSAQALEALALRASVLGDPTRAMALLEARGSRTGWDDGLQAVCRHVPEPRLQQLLTALQRLEPGQRAQGLAEILPRLPRTRRRRLLTQLVRDVGVLRVALAPRRVDLLRRFARDLSRLPAQELTSLWAAALEGSRESSREEVLVDVQAFAPALIAHFGVGVAEALDGALTVGGGPRWP